MENEQKYLTKTELAEFTEETLLPAVEKIVDDKLEEKLNVKFGEFRHEIKSYIDDKLADTKGDIIFAIRGEKDKDKSFKLKLVNMMKHDRINDQQEIAALEVLI
jgi:hypothetical protein